MHGSWRRRFTRARGHTLAFHTTDGWSAPAGAQIIAAPCPRLALGICLGSRGRQLRTAVVGIAQRASRRFTRNSASSELRHSQRQTLSCSSIIYIAPLTAIFKERNLDRCYDVQRILTRVTIGSRGYRPRSPSFKEESAKPGTEHSITRLEA